MNANDNGSCMPDEFMAELRLYTTHPHIAAALDAITQGGTKKIYVEIGDMKLYSIIMPK